LSCHREVRIETLALEDRFEHAARRALGGWFHAAFLGGRRVEGEQEQRTSAGQRHGAGDEEGLFHGVRVFAARIIRMRSAVPVHT